MKHLLGLTIFISTISAYADIRDTYLDLFKEKSPNIARIQILQYESNNSYIPGGLLIARGIVEPPEFANDWNNELFGIFYVSDDLTPLKILDILPTIRWRDTCVTLEKNTITEFSVIFKGCDHGHYLDKKVYDLK